MTPFERASPPFLVASPRFLAALVLSVLLHFSLPLFLSGGAPRQRDASPPPRALTVRVIPRPEQADASVPGVPAPEDPRQAEPRRAVRAERDAPAPSVSSAAAPLRSARPAGAAPEVPDLTYYTAKQIDIYPALAAPLDLEHRGKPAADGVTGRALLLVSIDEVGTVKDVSVIEAEPANTFEDDAKRALMSTRFSPAYRNGRAVRSRVLIAVNYGVERNSP